MSTANVNSVSGVPANLVKTHDPKVYYSVWMKHLCFLNASGLVGVPKCVAEIGPGSTLGVGLSALLSGAQEYYAFDLVAHTTIEENILLLDQLVELFRNKTGVSNSGGFPNYRGLVDATLFPSHILNEQDLSEALSPTRIASIRRALSEGWSGPQHDIRIQYVAPWEDRYQPLIGKVDLIVSHSVMEHVADIERAYSIYGELLRPGSWMSHQIDFKSHGFSKQWNGYWQVGDDEWARTIATQPYAINRQPSSRHLELLRSNGFAIVTQLSRLRPSPTARKQLAPAFRELSDYDLKCDGVFVQSIKIVSGAE